MNKEDLLKLIENDDLGILDVKLKQSAILTSEERLVASFHEINQFICDHGCEPSPGNDINEHRLYARLNGLRENKEHIKALLDLDEHGLLKKIVKEIRSIDDIFEDDNLGIFDDVADSIFDLKHVPKETAMPDYVARREPCKDFSAFEYLFKICHTDLASGKKILRPFANEQQIKQGSFFILKGVMVYVDEVGEKETKNKKVNARLRCIFENGTECDLLLRSLARELYKDGRRIFDVDGESFDKLELVTNEDINTGYIYILRSLSEKPEITSIENLYKIGFSKLSVEKRIKNAAMDPTYLMAPASIVITYKCYNMNPQKFELLLHSFFGSACLNVDVFDSEGRRHTPREWFIAPLEIIEQAINFLINGEIIYYQYDPDKKTITERPEVLTHL